MNNIVLVNLESTYASAYGIWQWDYGQILRIQSKKKLPKAVEVHFSEQEKGGSSVTRIGTTADNVTDVPIPDSLLEKSGNIYAFVYIEDGQSGNTEYKIEMSVKARPKPEIPGSPEEPELFKETIKAVNEAADRADTAEQNANDSASKAEEAAASASASAKAAENTKTEALEEIGNKKQDALSSIQAKKEESLSAIRTQEENSVSKVTEHTNEEIQRFQNVANESKGALDRSIEEAGEKKTSLDSSIQTADSSKANLDESIQNAGSAKSGLDASTGKAKDAKTELDGSIQTAGEKQAALDTIVGKAEELDTSLAKNIESGTQLQKELVAFGEKAVQDIQSAGTEQLDKMQTVADEFEADREQVNVNKENIVALTDDMEMVKDTKITKFYANNQGENHLADSDKGKIQDMMIFGKSEQFTTTGKNIFNPSVGGFISNTDGSITSGDISSIGATDFIKINGKDITVIARNFSSTMKGAYAYRIGFYDSEKKWIKNIIPADGNKYSINTFKVTDAEYIRVSAPSALYNTIQVEYGSEATSYEPYTGGIPSPNTDYPQEIKSVVNPVVKVCGKNLLNLQDAEYSGGGIAITFKNGVGVLNGTTVDEAYVQKIGEFIVKETGVYYIASATKDNSHEPRILIKVNNGDYGSAEKGVVKTLNAGNIVTLYIRISTVATYNDIIIKPMIIRGTSATYDDFEPYTEQLVQLPYTLNAIPVSSGGNVTIDGQQYVADYVDVERGKIIKCVEKYRIPSDLKWLYEPSENNRFGAYTLSININPNFAKNTLFTHYQNAQSGVGGFVMPNNIRLHNFQGFTDVTTFKEWLDKNELYSYFVKNTFEEINLTIEEIQIFKALSMYYPVTNISVNSEQLDGYTVFNYPVSMKNGWNYVKQQLNDNRDYIYDMDVKTQDIDTQAAEAYVNSEYAVALTELEV